MEEAIRDYLQAINNTKYGMFEAMVQKFMQENDAKPEDMMLVEQQKENGIRLFYARKERPDVAYPPDENALLLAISYVLANQNTPGFSTVILFMLSAIYPVNKETKLLWVQDNAKYVKVPIYKPIGIYKSEMTDYTVTEKDRIDEVLLDKSAGNHYRIGYSFKTNVLIVSKWG